MNIECEQHHTGLAVPDVPAAVEFYTTRLGFRLSFTWGDPVTFAGVQLDRVQIEKRLISGTLGGSNGGPPCIYPTRDSLSVSTTSAPR